MTSLSAKKARASSLSASTTAAPQPTSASEQQAEGIFFFGGKAYRSLDSIVNLLKVSPFPRCQGAGRAEAARAHPPKAGGGGSTPPWYAGKEHAQEGVPGCSQDWADGARSS